MWWLLKKVNSKEVRTKETLLFGLKSISGGKSNERANMYVAHACQVFTCLFIQTALYVRATLNMTK
jgi:hypothetical protein